MTHNNKFAEMVRNRSALPKRTRKPPTRPALEKSSPRCTPRVVASHFGNTFESTGGYLI
jgi:hypothetical protein